MKQIKKIAITGSIATGKSTVTKMIRDAGYSVINSDAVSREITSKGSVGLNRIILEFGEDYLTDNGELNRSKLGELIFSDLDQRNKLNSILHPLIINEIKNKINNSKEEIIFIDIPLYFEIKEELDKLGLFFDEVVIVYSNKSIQLKRLIKRDSINEHSAKLKISSQMSVNKKKKLADYVIDNNGSLSDLKEEVDTYLNKLRGFKWRSL